MGGGIERPKRATLPDFGSPIDVISGFLLIKPECVKQH